MLRWLKTVVVSDQGKGATRSRQVGIRKTLQSARPDSEPGVVVEASKGTDGIETEGLVCPEG